MARAKKNASKEIQLVESRLAGMKTISPTLDLGKGITVASVETEIEAVKTEISEYNEMLSAVDQKRLHVEAKIAGLVNLGGNILSATEYKFGDDSDEYEVVGGVRKSKRKKPTRKPKETIK